MNLSRIGKNIDMIRRERGLSIARLSQKLGIGYQTCRNHICIGRMNLETLVAYSEILGCEVADLLDGVKDPDAEGEEIEPEIFRLEDLAKSYPWNLVVDVFGDAEKIYQVYIPSVLASVKQLSEIEQEIISDRYIRNMTLDQVSKRIGVSRERVRQREAKAIRKLRHPSHTRSWLFDTMNKADEIGIEASRLRLENIILRNRIKAFEVSDESGELLSVEQNADIPIEDLELSVRSYNCLRRAGVYKLSDMEGWTQERLMKVRNLGRKSLEEVVRKLNERGIVVPCEEG